MDKKDYGILLVSVFPYDDYFLSESLGVEYLNAILLESGYSSRVLVARGCELSFERMLSETKNVYFIGYTAYSENVGHISEMASALKTVRPNLHICIGGPLSLFCAEQILKDCRNIDSVAIGEAYETIVELVERLRTNTPLKSCNGLCYRDSNGNISWTPHREVVKDLDSVPFATRTTLNQNQETLVANLLTSTGCIGNCSFCAESEIFNHLRKLNPSQLPVRYRNIDKVVEELVLIIDKTGFDTFEIIDSSFEGYGDFGKLRVEEFADKLIELKIPCYFICNFRAESFHEGANDELIEKLFKAGLSLVFIGAESGCDSTLKYFHKRASVRDNLLAIHLFQQYGIATELGFIMFHPMTTFQELRENLIFLEKAGFAWDIDLYQKELALYPGAPIIEKFKAQPNIFKSTFSYNRPYDYNYVDLDVRIFVDYLRRKNPAKDLAIKISVPILHTDILLAKLRKNDSLKKHCEQWMQKLITIKNELGLCNIQWFRSCMDAIEDGNVNMGELDRLSQNWNIEIEQKTFAKCVKDIEMGVILQLQQHHIPYTIKDSPWGNTIYPTRMMN